MDDVTSLLPTANHQAINNVHLYLWVFYLSEISDANGLQILPSTLENSQCISGSTIRWPNQPKPTPTAWKHWTNAIRALYLHTDSNKLKQPLQIWYQSTVNQDWQWTWRINPNTHMLYHWTRTEWTGQRPEVTRRTYIEY